MEIQRLAPGRGLTWIAEGFALFRAEPLIWIVEIVLLIVALSLLSMVPLLGSLLATVLQPVFLAGLLRGCRDLDQGQEFRLEHLFVGFRENTRSLLALGLWLALAWVGIAAMLVVAALGAGLFGSALFDSAEWPDGLPRWADQAALLGVLLMASLGLLLYLPVAMAAWFAPALVLFDDLDAWKALKASFLGCLRNAWPLLVYGAALLLLLLVAVIPFGLGLLVWVPVLLASVYVSYREIYASHGCGN